MHQFSATEHDRTAEAAAFPASGSGPFSPPAQPLDTNAVTASNESHPVRTPDNDSIEFSFKHLPTLEIYPKGSEVSKTSEV
jgi:hypothetical protein